MIARILAWISRQLDAGWDDYDKPTYLDSETVEAYPQMPTGPLRTEYHGDLEPAHERLRRGDVWRSPRGVLVWQGDHWAPAFGGELT